MSAPDFASVLDRHRINYGTSLVTPEGDWYAYCSCGEWTFNGSSVDLASSHDAHVAAALHAELVAWLGGEAERRDPGSVWWQIMHYGPLDAEPFQYSRFESPAHAALVALAQTGGGE